MYFTNKKYFAIIIIVKRKEIRSAGQKILLKKIKKTLDKIKIFCYNKYIR